jgi:hypothetical protein
VFQQSAGRAGASIGPAILRRKSMATLTVSVTQDFSAVALSNIDRIEFTNSAIAGLATATFASTQFDNVAILNNVTFDGSTGTKKSW